MRIPADLEPLERQLWKAIDTGELVKPRGGRASETLDARAGGKWGRKRTVRADVLATLLTRPRSRGCPTRALRLRQARVSGTLDLKAARLQYPLDLRECFFDEPVHLDDAQIPRLVLSDCSLPSITASQLETRGDVCLDGSYAQFIELRGANIGGRLNLDKVNLAMARGRALNTEGARVGGNFTCQEAQVEGELRLVGSQVRGQLFMSGAKLANPQDDARDGRSALNTDRACIEGDVFCRQGFHVEGEFRLLGTRIGGQLNLSGAQLDNPAGDALSTDGAQIVGDMICSGLRTTGAIRLLGTQIGGQLNFDKAQLDNGLEVALNASRAEIKEDVFFQEGFRAEGVLCFPGAHIGGILNLDEAKICRLGGIALDLRQAVIMQLVLPARTSPEGTVDLRDAHITHFVDTWPQISYSADLDGLTYDTLAPLPIGASARVNWVAASKRGFLPQPYEQLVAVLRRSGRDDDARSVAIAKERHRCSELKLASKARIGFLGATVGYGYKPGRGLWWLAGLVVIDCGVFAWAKAEHAFHVVGEKNQWLPQFHLLLYALDHVLPVIELGQRGYWTTTGPFQFWQTFSDLAGWLLVTVILGAVTSRLIRN